MLTYFLVLLVIVTIDAVAAFAILATGKAFAVKLKAARILAIATLTRGSRLHILCIWQHISLLVNLRVVIVLDHVHLLWLLLLLMTVHCVL